MLHLKTSEMSIDMGSSIVHWGLEILETAMETTNIGLWKYWKQQSKQLTWPTLVSGRRGGTGGRGRWLRPQSQETPIFQLIFANVFVFVFAFVSVVVFVSPE